MEKQLEHIMDEEEKRKDQSDIDTSNIAKISQINLEEKKESKSNIEGGDVSGPEEKKLQMNNFLENSPAL